MDDLSTNQYLGYQQALTKTAYFQHKDPGYIKISGEDQQAFLQRQTSNNIDRLSPQSCLVTVLTSPNGRILDVLTVLAGEKMLGILTLPGQGEKTFEFLRSRIFFMDKVTLEDASSRVTQIDLLGPESTQVIQLWGVEHVDDRDRLHKIKVNETPVQVLQQRNFGYRILAPIESTGEIISELQSMGVPALNFESYQLLRIEAGVPTAGHELTEEYTPLETGYHWAVSADKGCYTGQEVLARQVNYDKITRQMVGLSLSTIADIGDTLYPLDKDQPIGKITSAAVSPRFGPIALAIVKRDYNQPGGKLRVGADASGMHASIAQIPFQEHNPPAK
jgi:folate-binding protein YgfZ